MITGALQENLIQEPSNASPWDILLQKRVTGVGALLKGSFL
jgi:hypothetical protein